MTHERCSVKSNLDYSLITTIKNTAPNVADSEALFSHSKCSGQMGLQQGSHITNCDTLWGIWLLSESKHVYSRMADRLPDREATHCGWRTQPNTGDAPRYQSPWATKGSLLHPVGRITVSIPQQH